MKIVLKLIFIVLNLFSVFGALSFLYYMYSFLVPTGLVTILLPVTLFALCFSFFTIYKLLQFNFREFPNKQILIVAILSLIPWFSWLLCVIWVLAHFGIN